MKYLSRTYLSVLAVALMSAAAEAAVGGSEAPAAPEATKELTKKELKAKEAAEKKAAKEKAAADKAAAEAAKPAKVEAPKQNGVTRPSSGKTKQVWDTADLMSKELKAPVGRKALTDKLLADGLVVGTIHTQYGKWRKFHGLAAEKVVKPAEAPAAAAEATTEQNAAAAEGAAQ